MLNSSWKKMGDGREREVGDARRGIRGERGKYGQHVTEFPTVFTIACMVLYDNVYMHHSHSQLTS